MNAAITLLDRFSRLTGQLVSWLTLTLVLVTFAVVVLRYVFDLGWIAMQESANYMHATVFMLGAAYTLHAQGHVRVDIFYEKFGPRGQALVNLLGTLLLLFPITGFIFWVSWEYVSASWSVWEGSREAGGLPGVFLLKSLILLLPLTLALQGLAEILRSLQVLGQGSENG
ncbi:MAG: TRAP transporter small permease subunit [bacterium]